MAINKWALIGITCFCPPLAVYLCEGAKISVLVNVFFCCCIWFPGVLHALHIIGKTRFKDEYTDESEIEKP